MDKKDNICLYASYLIAGLVLIVVFPIGLLPCLIAGMVTYELIAAISSKIAGRMKLRAANMIAVFSIIVFVIIVILLSVTGIYEILSSDFSNESDFYKKANFFIKEAQQTLSPAMRAYFPVNFQDFQDVLFDWIEMNLPLLQIVGQRTIHFLTMVFIGMILAAVITLTHGEKSISNRGPLANHLHNRIVTFRDAFRNVIMAQIKVAAINSLLTGFFLYFIMPIFNYDLPYVKSIIVITFICGLLPIIGNLISNAIILTLSLSISLNAGILSLVFLVFVHKLEYFINAKVFGGNLNSKAWELLLAMLVFESFFGIAGVVVAPVYFAYIKSELKSGKLI